MRIYKERQYLVFDFEDGRTVKYDFSTKQAIGIKGKPVKDLKSQLRGFSINQLFECCDDKQYAKFLNFIRDSECYQIDNIGTILDRVPKYSRFEQIFSAGFESIIRDGKHFKYSINEIPKSLIKLCKQYKIKLSNDIVKFYKEYPDAHYIAYNLDFISLDESDIFDAWTVSGWNPGIGNVSYFNQLIYFGYNAKDLWLYIDRLKTFEAIENIREILTEIYDYSVMMQKISPKYDKYPRHFLTTHRIACRNYSRLKREFSEKAFKTRIIKDYEYTFGDYIFIYPKSTQEIKDEATQQSNCVASYIDRVIDGECHILFLRKKDKPEESLITIEVRNNKIVQARRRFNDPVTKEDQKAIDAFNKRFAEKENKIA